MKPNVILMNCDDLGYGDLGCYGSHKNYTPNIDKLASEGLLFKSFYAASPICSPSRASLMTGCYPNRIGIYRVLFPCDNIGLNKEEYTMPQLFKNAGYKTMIVGKWHCGDQKETLPLDFGFDDYFGLPYSNDMGIQKGSTRDNKRFPPLPLINGNEIIEEQPDQTGLTERYVEKSVEFIRNNKDNPFFLYFAHMYVHLPLYAPENYTDKSSNGDFGACMSVIDWSIKTLVDELKKQNIYENTIIIFTSDNGANLKCGSCNDPLKGTKNSTWEGGQRVPFIVHWKGNIPENVTINNIASNIDLLPTFAAILDEKLSDKKIDGKDISPMFYGKDKQIRNDFCYYLNHNFEAYRFLQWKLYFSRANKKVCDLYNLDNDIGENNNVYEIYPEIVKILTQKAKIYFRELGDEITNVKGEEIRPCHVTSNPDTLTHFSPDHPYIISMYDKEEAG